MQVSSRNIAKALMHSLYEGTDPSKLAKSFAKYLEENHLIGLAPNILNSLDKEVSDREKMSMADIRVSHEMTSTVVKGIENKIQKDAADKSVVTVDKDLIGGFKAVYRGRVFDGSIKNYLKEMRAKLNE